MSIEIVEVKTAAERREFALLPYQLYKGVAGWVPPMFTDEINSIDPKKNPAFDISITKFWIARRNGHCIGRIGGLIIKPRLEKTGEKLARFTRPEFIDDAEVANLLIKTVEDWAFEMQMDGIHGPLGFSNLDHQGLLVEGHEYIAAVASDYHHAYYQKHYDRLGYEKEIDWLEFRVTFPEKMPDKAFRVADLIKERFHLKSVNFTEKKELEPYKTKIFKLFNEAFENLFGTYKLPESLSKYYIDKYFPILNPRFVKIVEDKDNEIAGFLIALPSLSKAMQKANGKLWPFGWYHIMQAMKHPTEMELMLTGVRPEFQKLGASSLLMNEIWKTAKEHNMQFVETTGMLENNHVAIQIWKSFDHIQHKRKRCFIKWWNKPVQPNTEENN